MLIKTLAEIKAVLPKLVSNLKDTSALPNFDRAEGKHLVPITGKALYHDLRTKYAAGTLSGAEQDLLKKMQLVVAAYGFLDDLAFSHALITDTGVRTMNTGNLNKAVGWEYKELKTALEQTALDGVEVLLQGLIDYNSALWTESEEYRAFRSLLIKTGLEFDSIVKLHQPQRTFWHIRTVVADVQENYIRNAIGPDLVDYLNNHTELSPSEAYILKLLKKALAHYSIKHACEHYTTRFDATGFTVVSYVGDMNSLDNSGRTTAKDLIDFKMNASDRDGAAYLAKALYELHAWNEQAAASPEFKEAYAAGPLASYKKPSERDRGNGSRKLFRF